MRPNREERDPLRGHKGPLRALRRRGPTAAAAAAVLAWAAAALLTSSCASSLDDLQEVRVPIDQAAVIAGQIEGALRAGDVNGDGAIQGVGEWVAFAEAIYAIVRDLDV